MRWGCGGEGQRVRIRVRERVSVRVWARVNARGNARVEIRVRARVKVRVKARVGGRVTVGVRTRTTSAVCLCRPSITPCPWSARISFARMIRRDMVVPGTGKE